MNTRLLKNIFTDVSSPGGFSSPENLYNEAKKLDKNITRKQVQEFLQNQRSYTLHRQIKRKFPRQKYVA